MKQLEKFIGAPKGREGHRTEGKGQEELSTSCSVLRKASSGGKPWEYITSRFIHLILKMNVSGVYHIKQ